MKNIAAIMNKVRSMDIEETDVPQVKDNEVLVKIEYVGICGSDVHLYQEGKLGEYLADDPIILGHESAGVVEKAGKAVQHLKVGDKVALEPGVACGTCIYCKSGLYNLCPSVVFMAVPPYNGAFAKYVAHPADMAFKLPENVSTMEGSLVEPLAVGLHAAKRGGVELGSKVVILGSGCIGLVTLLSCKARGATEIMVVDVVDKRLEYAKKLGATQVINALKEDVIEIVNKKTDHEGADVVIECAGNEKTMMQTSYLVKRGGKIVLIGMAAKDIIPFNFTKLIWKEADIHTVFRYRNLYPAAIEAISKGVIDVKRIVTQTFELNDIQNAFEYVIEHKEDVVKAVVKI